MESKPATIREIAKAAGVSPSTVFRVLNSGASVSPNTRAKVIAAQQILQNKKAITPAKESSRFSVGTIIFDEKTMSPQSLIASPKDGYLIIGTSEEQERTLVPLLSEAGLPSLLINRQAKDLHTSSVNVDDTAATMDATEHLISLGHQNIAFIGGNKNFQNTKHRLLGYQIAMERHNLPLENDHILFGEFSEFSGYQQGKTILNMLHRPTAAICASDPLAIGCMRALTEGGLRLPDDFAVIGFGNIEASKYVTPSLSTVSQPSQEMGTIAAATLIQMLENPIILSQKVRLKTNLVLRDSSGFPIGSR